MKSNQKSAWRGILTIAVVFILPLIAAGALPVPIQSYSVPEDHILRVNVGPFPTTLDPQLAFYTYEIGHLRLIYEGLTRLDTGLNTVPGAAESWQYNTDATEVTFILRAGLTYSDGSVLNAKRFEYSLLRAIDPVLGSDYGYYLLEVIGANAYYFADPAALTPQELQALRDAVQIKAYTMSDVLCENYAQTDCRKLKFRLTQTTTAFHTYMTTWITYPVKQEIIDLFGGTWWQASLHHIGNGPFVLSSIDSTSQSYFIPNQHYWRGIASYDIAFKYYGDTITAFNDYKSNLLDITTAGPEVAWQVKTDPVLNQQMHTYAASCSFAIMYHNLKAPFNNQKIREAFSYALNRQAWVDNVLAGGGIPALTWIPPGVPGYDSTETRFGYNPIAAVQALNDSGYILENGDLKLPGGQPIEILDSYVNTSRNQVRHEWLREKWYQTLGVEITLNPVDSATYTELTKNPATAPPIQILGWCMDYPDPQNWLSVYWYTNGFASRIGYSNATLDAMLDEADSTIDPVLRIEKYINAHRYLVSTCPATFMWHSNNAFLVKPRVNGEVGTAMDWVWMGEMDPLLITLGPVWDYAVFLPNIHR